MSIIQVKAPSVGESITEVSILKWHKQKGAAVSVGEILLEIESDKATVEVIAEAKGELSIIIPEGERVAIGAVLAEIDTSKSGSTGTTAANPTTTLATPPAPPSSAPSSAATAAGGNGHPMSPAVQRVVTETGLATGSIIGTGKDGRLTKGDVLAASTAPMASTQTPPATPSSKVGERRVKMSMLRSKIAERLVYAQHTAAILTTFNEVDMTEVNKIRARYKDAFKAKYGVPLSFMSFFGRACVESLKLIPAVNGSIEGQEIIYRDFVDLGIAVGTERGLVVPVIRGAEKMGFFDLESSLGALATKARAGKLSMADLSGGTFTISNGGTYGSLLSTPILNPPQSGILGMHKIQDRPMVMDGSIQIRPMMYLALSYDHRIIDGKEAVTFLINVKQFLEKPETLNLEFTRELNV